MKKIILSVLVSFVSLCICFALPVKEKTKGKSYVASTSWVGSIAQLSGIDDVVVIAPSSLKHPPEYEITPDDVYTISQADLFMQAGYERMMKTISKAAEVNPDKIIKVKTTNTLENLRNMVNLISSKADTEDKANRNYRKLEKLISNARKKISESPNKDIEVYSHKDQAEFARDLGLNVVSTFGPGQLTSSQFLEVARNKYALVIDNFHNPIALPIKEVSPNSVIITFRNFPDSVDNDSLYNLIKDNLDLLWETDLF